MARRAIPKPASLPISSISTWACLTLMVVASVAPIGCAGSANRERLAAPRPARINHVVLFKLNDPSQADELIQDCDTMLGNLPGVASYFAGKNLDLGRSNVDGNYDVGFFVGFDTEQAYREYVNHPRHIEVVRKWKPRWEWIRIHDVLDTTP